MKNPRRPSRGFTLIELLVSIAVTSIIVALLLPAVMSAREAARKTICRNHIKQLGLALHNYHQSFRTFPPGAIAATSPQTISVCSSGNAFPGIDLWDEAANGSGNQGTSWMLAVLPYVDEGSRYDQWYFGTNVVGNRSVAEADVSLFYCPSRRSNVSNIAIMFGQWTAGGTDYGGCIGACNGWHNCGAHESWMTAAGGRALDECQGVFWVNRGARIARISDGTTNTILLGELQRLDEGTDITTSRDGWAVGGVSNLFSTCSDVCAGINSPHFEEPGSSHNGGAHFGLADGSVRFLSDSISVDVFRALGQMAGDGPTSF